MLAALRKARAWLTDVTYGAGLVAWHRNAIEADLPQRLDLVKAGFNRQEAELARARTRLRQAAQEGRKQAAEQLELVKVRHSALSKVRGAARRDPGRAGFHRARPGVASSPMR